MARNTIALYAALLLSFTAAAQGTPHGSIGIGTGSGGGISTSQSLGASSGRWHLGGSFGFSIGDYTHIGISPQIGHAVTSYLTLGGGLSYDHYSRSETHSSRNYIGADLFARLYPIRYIVLQLQPEIQRSWGRSNGVSSTSEVCACLVLGGGVTYPVSSSGDISAMIHYDVLQNDYSPYGNRIFYSVGYTYHW